MAEESDTISLPLVHLGAEDVPIFYANHFVLQAQPDEFILLIGQVTPPIILRSTDDERRAQSRKIPYVPVKVVARVAMNARRVRELRDLLDKQLEQIGDGHAEEGG